MKASHSVTVAMGLSAGFAACGGPAPNKVKDEAILAGADAQKFHAADEDYFRAMDDGVALTPDEVQGRNTWIVWTAGDDRLWDKMSVASNGALDFLKTLSSHPALKNSRDSRWNYLGLVNEPCFVKATGPDPKRYNLWLDQRRPDCPPDPFENEQKYPGVRYGARGKNIPAGSYYGFASGVVGLRLFPNPDFDEAAERAWNAERYYTDPSYYERKDLIKPYRVGMSCGFCHVGPNPVKPPADPNAPRWENLSSNVGAQFFWVDRVFYWSGDEQNFPFQVFHMSRPGTLDTSLISTDNIGNPRTMNAVYLIQPRLAQALRWGKERLAGEELNNKQFNNYVSSGPLTQFFRGPDTVWTPRVLKDGSDSVGVLGALNRVYLNIGAFSEEWLLHFNPLVGGKPISPILISTSQKNSAYYAATEQQTLDMALFLVKASAPHHLKDAPGGARYLQADADTLRRGKVVFAETCARCHSSKLPEKVPALDEGGGCAGKDYLSCWDKYWAWTKTPEFKDQMRSIVLADDFLADNYLSAELRVPVTLLHTNACSPLATNAIKDNIWDNYSSESYKELPSVGAVSWYQPFTGERRALTMPAGGRGYTRPASLVSLWSTAPFLQNNTVGPFDPSPSVDARMGVFQKSIEQMLWPELREHDAVLGKKVPGTIDRTTVPSYVLVPGGYLPDALRSLLPWTQRLAPSIFGEGGIKIGPIPEGTPVGLLANLQILSEEGDVGQRAAHDARLLGVVGKLLGDLQKLGARATSAQAAEVFANLEEPLLAVSKCPDLVVNRGHYFGTGYVEPGDPTPADEPGLSDADKRALIEYLKTF
jgi:hypothetical protein